MATQDFTFTVEDTTFADIIYLFGPVPLDENGTPTMTDPEFVRNHYLKMYERDVKRARDKKDKDAVNNDVTGVIS